MSLQELKVERIKSLEHIIKAFGSKGIPPTSLVKQIVTKWGLSEKVVLGYLKNLEQVGKIKNTGKMLIARENL